MNTHYLIIASVALLFVLAPPAAAQSPDDLPGQNETNQEPPAHERIDEHTQLVDANLVDGTAVLMIKSSKNQKITITDAGAMMRGGEIPRQDFIVREGEITTIRMDVYSENGFAGVTVDTGSTLWAVPLEDPYTFLPGGPTTSDVQLAGLTGLATTGILALAIAVKRRRGIGDEVERIV